MFAWGSFVVPQGASPVVTVALTVLWLAMIAYGCWHAVSYVRRAIWRK